MLLWCIYSVPRRDLVRPLRPQQTRHPRGVRLPLPPAGPGELSCDWRRAGHVTPVLSSYWPGGADQPLPKRDLPLRLAHHLLPRPEHGQGQLLRVHPEGNNQIVKIFASNKNIFKMSGSGETHIADENDRDNERDDSTLPLKK